MLIRAVTKALVLAVVVGIPVARAEGPRLVRDVNLVEESIGRGPGELVAAGAWVYFRGWDSVHGHELWRSDGEGVEMVGDLRVGNQGSWPQRLVAVGDRLFFFADDGVHGVELWTADGGSARMTGDLKEGTAEFSPVAVEEAGGLMDFTEGPAGGLWGSPFGWGLWRSDGTAAGTWMLNPVVFPDDGMLHRPFGRATHLTGVGDQLFFCHAERELWRSGGSAEGTVRLAHVGEGGVIASMVAGGDRLWFTVRRAGARELWWCDGETC